MDFTALSPQKRLFHEHVHAIYQEVHHTAMTAPNGHVLAQAEPRPKSRQRLLEIHRSR